MDEKKMLEKELKAFCSARRGEMDGQSRVLVHGRLAFRKSSRVVIRSIAGCLASIKEIYGKAAKHFILVEEKPNKEALEKLTDDDLLKVGCKRSEQESFTVEINWESLE